MSCKKPQNAIAKVQTFSQKNADAAYMQNQGGQWPCQSVKVALQRNTIGGIIARVLAVTATTTLKTKDRHIVPFITRSEKLVFDLFSDLEENRNKINAVLHSRRNARQERERKRVTKIYLHNLQPYELLMRYGMVQGSCCATNAGVCFYAII